MEADAPPLPPSGNHLEQRVERSLQNLALPGGAEDTTREDLDFLSASQEEDPPTAPLSSGGEPNAQNESASFFDNPESQQIASQDSETSNILSQLGIPTANDNSFPEVKQSQDEGNFQDPSDHTYVESQIIKSPAAQEPASEDVDQDEDTEHDVRTQQSDPEQVEPSHTTPEPAFEERSASPGERLFDQVAHHTAHSAVFGDETATDWMATAAPTEHNLSQPAQDMIEQESQPLVDHNQISGDSEHVDGNDTQADGFFGSPEAEDEANMGWMQSEITTEEPTPVVESHSLQDAQPLAPEQISSNWDADRSIEEDQSQEPAQDAPPAQPAEDIEDSWAQAFDSGDLDDSWDQAFSSGMDDDDVQEDPVPAMDATSSSRYAPSTSVSSQPGSQPTPRAPLSASYGAPYSAAMPIQPPAPKQQEKAKPMEFFAELPTSSIRSRKPQRPVAPQAQPTPPPPSSYTQPPASYSQPPDPRPPSNSSYQSFAGPGRLELFPPQPSVPPPPQQDINIPAQPAPSNQRHAPAASSRYSPAPTQPVQQPSAPVPIPSQTSAPSVQQPAQTNQLSPPSAHVPSNQRLGRPQAAPAAAPRGRSPYAPAPAQSGRKSSPYASPPSQHAAPPPRTSSQAAQPPTQLAPPNSSPSHYTAAKPQAASRSPQRVTDPGFFEPLPPPPAHRFAPRTSSPLAHSSQERPHVDRSVTMPMPPHESQSQATHAPHRSLGDESSDASIPPTQRPAPPLAAQRYSPSRILDSQAPPPSSYASHTTFGHQQQPDLGMPPPTRPQTSSPTKTRHPAPPNRDAGERPASAHTSAPPPSGFNPSSRMARKSISTGPKLDFVPPLDDTAQDPMERWKGCPIFRWGPNGSILTCAPQQIPRYGGGQAAPKLKCLPREPKLERASDVVPDESHVTSFPGPLKSKGKKKDVVAWLSGMVESMEHEHTGLDAVGHDLSRVEERTLLWKCMRVFIENDGHLSGNEAVESAVKQIFLPPAEQMRHQEVAPASSSPSDNQQSRQAVIQELKHFLLNGEREKAVWLAVDNRLWSHAMLISSTLSRDVWKQVVQEFVRKDVRSPDQPNHSLAALYEVFAGDWEDSIDQLVPVSARSGFQMVSTADRGNQPRDAMEGLHKWRETLSLILNNRSSEDEKAILALGKLLASYGRIEAAHICYLFAKSVANFGGADDASTHLALVGFDHTSPDTVVNLDSILLSEIYEFGLSFTAQSSFSLPHLQAYKLRHAYALAEMGQQTEALAYCEVIASALSSKTRVSPYYHAALISQLDDLQKRLSQSPKDGASWMKTKPTIGKVSSSMGKWFNTFVEGDGDDAASNGSGYQSDADAGPFTRNLGGTPSISRSASATDLFSADFSRAQAIPTQLPPMSNSKYAPSAYAPRSSLEQDRGASLSTYSSSPENRFLGAYSPRVSSESPSHQYGSPPTSSSSYQRQPSGLSQLQTHQREDSQPSSQNSNIPDVEEETPVASYPSQSHDQKMNGYVPSPNGHAPSYGDYQPEYGQYYQPEPFSNDSSSGGYEPSQPSYQPQTSSYSPSTSSYDPTAGSYAPPSYDPSAGNPTSPTQDEPRKKQFTDDIDDDDDDIAARAASLKSQPSQPQSSQKASNDRVADDAFRAAAEADAARDKSDKEKRTSSGWFKMPSLNPFGGKKSQDLSGSGGAGPQVHKAHMGEANSFYFDEVAKKWVNKKAGSPTPEQAVGVTPPPPKAGPPRVVSAQAPPMGGPPVGGLKPPTSMPSTVAEGDPPASRAGTPSSIGSGEYTAGPTSDPTASAPAAAPPAPGASTNLTPATSGLAPPSRPGTSTSNVSNASSIDDLMGTAGARSGGKGSTVGRKKGKGGSRYVDVMGGK